jgi:hypothetical protein
MSQLEVDKIIPQSGTTLTIGDSGDTITFADGAVIGIDTDTLYIDSANNRVGIGTSSPGSYLADKLVVATSTSDDGITIASTGTNLTHYLMFADGTTGLDRYRGAIGYNHNDNSLRLLSDGTERIRIDSSGHVGVGTSTLPRTLNIYGASNGTIGLDNQVSGSPQIAFKQDGTDKAFVTYWDAFDTLALSDDSGNGLHFKPSTGNVGIGTSSPSAKLTVIEDVSRSALTGTGVGQIHISGGATPADNDVSSITFSTNNTTTASSIIGSQLTNNGSNLFFGTSGNYAAGVNNTAMFIDSSGNVLINKTANSFTTAGVILNSAGNCFFTASGDSGVNVNRLSDDGALVRFYQANSEEGSISVSGATVSYNGFTGTHWSRLADNSKPTILKGTILESLDEMMDWYQVQFDITETDDEGNETTRTEKQSYALGDGESVGDVITYNYEGTDYQATIIQEDDIKHTKSKISDTVDAKNVYGVFMAWDNDDDTVNDMYVAQTGTFVVRINGSETVSKGDLIQSNGDGTGKVQADDLLRASTVAKVLSTTKIETYEDGSYIVPCSLHC